MVEVAVHNSNLQGHPWNADSGRGVQRQRPVCFISQRGCCPWCWEVTISDVDNYQNFWKSSPTRLLPRCDMCIVQLLKCNINISILSKLQFGPTSVHMNNLGSWRVDIVAFYISPFSYFNHCLYLTGWVLRFCPSPSKTFMTMWHIYRYTFQFTNIHIRRIDIWDG